MSKFKWETGKPGREKWAVLLVCGLLLLLIAAPMGGKGRTAETSASIREREELSLLPADGQEAAGKGKVVEKSEEKVEDAFGVQRAYERQMEERVKELLKGVEGVGEVDVMIVLKSSEEKVIRVDQSRSRSSTEESDSAGGSRKVMNEEVSRDSVFSEHGEEKIPVVEKELSPEIEGIVVSAQGGGNAAIRTEISEAMEALFHIPVHKIKVLKRVD